MSRGARNRETATAAFGVQGGKRLRVGSPRLVSRQLALKTQEALLVPRFDQFVNQGGGGDEADRQTLLAGCEPQAERDVRFVRVGQGNLRTQPTAIRWIPPGGIPHRIRHWKPRSLGRSRRARYRRLKANIRSCPCPAFQSTGLTHMSHDDHAFDPALRSRIRETLEPVRMQSWPVVASRVD
jgi:hypothetical protein